MRHRLLVLSTLFALCTAASAQTVQVGTSDSAPRLSALAKIPIRELTVFKDGHAFVLHEGSMPTDSTGNVLLDYLPTPVIGTFWAYSSTPQAKLVAVISSPRRTLIERTALNIREMLEANIGAEVVVQENNDVPKYSATIMAVPQRSSRELELAAGDSVRPLPQKGDIILLQTNDGVKALPVTQIRDVTFKTPPKNTGDNEEWRNLLTMKLNWNNVAPRKADVGLMYLQKGVRWIPSYRITLQKNKTARVELQATLINELTDLQNTQMNLVIGVPSFMFKDTPDPISLQNTFAQLSPYFRSDSRSAAYFSNAIATQVSTRGRFTYSDEETPVNDTGPEIAGGGKNEDLFIFTIKNVSLKKGERMVVPITEYALPYKDIFALDLPFAPPAEAYRGFNSEQQRQISDLLAAPKVQHKIRLTNKSNQPLTTAPALVIKDGQVLAQGMMTYTAPGGEGDVDLTSAVDVRIAKSDVETLRTPDAAKWQGYDYARIDLRGQIALRSYRKEPVEIEVTRYVLGAVDAADDSAKTEKMNVFEDRAFLPGGDYPDWWRWSSDWGVWWSHFNGVARIKWNVRLDPAKESTLNYTWHYFWRG